VRKKRELIDGAFYHVTSRTNNKIRVFDNKLGRKIMVSTLQKAKDKYHFLLANFCVMPTHLHLLIKPENSSNLCKIIQWIKLQSAKHWNYIHGSTDHLWGHRFFSRAVKDQQEYEYVMEYIDQNPVKAGIASSPAEWKGSGAYYKSQGLTELIYYGQFEQTKYQDVIMLLPVPALVSNLLPAAQLEHTINHYGAYAQYFELLYETVRRMPVISGTKSIKATYASLRYYTPTADYFIYEYDKQDTMFVKYRLNVLPYTMENKKTSLSKLKTIQDIKLDLSWIPSIL